VSGSPPSEAGPRILIAGGGTGGHIIPALAIADELKAQHGAEILFVGTARGLESRLVPQAGYRLELMRVGQLNNVSLATRSPRSYSVVAIKRTLIAFLPAPISWRSSNRSILV